MVIPIMKKDLVNTTSGNPEPDKNPGKNVGSSSNIDSDDKDSLTGDDIRQVNAVDKIFKVSEALERRFENKFNRNQPISFGEKLGEKIEARMTDTIIDKMMTGMFNVGGSATKPSGWLEIVKTVLDSNFAAQAGAKLPETIQALSKTIGPQKTEQLADAVVQAVNPNAKNANIENEQRKMEKFVLNLNPVNLADVDKFMELVNTNPANVKITDVNQARNILIEEQDRIRASNPELAKMLDENSDMDRGRRLPLQSSHGQKYNPFDNTIPRDMSMSPTSGNYNQMTPEEIQSIDSNSDEAVISYAWRKGPGQFDFNIDNLYDKSNRSSLEKIRSILRREQDSLLKGVEQGQLPIEGQDSGVDSKWDNNDIGKKAKMNKNGEISIIPNIADGPVTEDDEVRVMKKSEFLEEIGMKPKDQQPIVQSEGQNSIMELLQKMANNFDNGVSKLNNKLQMMENRINKIENGNLQQIQQTIIPKIEIIPEVDTIPDTIVEEKIVDTVPEITTEENEENVEEDQKQEELQEDIDTENLSNMTPIDVKNTRSKGGRIKVPRSILDEPKEEEKDEQVQTPVIKYPKGTQGWLQEQKRLKEQKIKDKINTD